MWGWGWRSGLLLSYVLQCVHPVVQRVQRGEDGGRLLSPALFESKQELVEAVREDVDINPWLGGCCYRLAALGREPPWHTRLWHGKGRGLGGSRVAHDGISEGV